jgi:hypothetical protein
LHFFEPDLRVRATINAGVVPFQKSRVFSVIEPERCGVWR